MELIIAELSRYIIVILFALYTFYSYRAFIGRAAGNNEGVFRAQRVLIVMLHLACSAVILVEEKEIKYVVLWALELFFFLFFTKIYQVFYRGMSKLIWNNMMICMMIGFIMLGRLSYDYAIRQLVMASLALGVCLLVPLFIERFTIWEKIGWQYALAGVLLLLLVFVIGVEKYGARNWISIGGFELQPSEFVKIIYVFFIASLLAKRTDFKSVAVISIAAAVHVGILVLEKDLGAALIYFVTYLMMLYVATMKLRYLAAGAFAGTAASVVAYQLFAHVRVRVAAWQDPWSNMNQGGYQICQSLFAIGTGGLFGMGLGQGMPKSVPVVESDFIFSAIAEEMGVIFCIVPGEKCWGVKDVDVYMPAAMQNDVKMESAEKIAKSGVKYYIEVANMPTTNDALNFLREQKHMIVAPSKAVNAGGVGVSGLEMAQNSERLVWTAEEVDAQLHKMMKNIHKVSAEAAEEYGLGYDLVAGANIAGFKKVAQAMYEQGVF